MRKPSTSTPASAIAEGIKTVGIGRRGSKPMPPDLIDRLCLDLTANKVSTLAKGAFFGALSQKGWTDDERRLLPAIGLTAEDAPALADTLTADAPADIQQISIQLLSGKTLPGDEALRLGRFLFSDEAGEGARGLAASILRVRYETDEEYAALLTAMEETFTGAFDQPVPAGEPVIQIAEPFDGCDHTYVITPLVADHLQSRGYRVVSLTGRNSGPKFGNNLDAIATELGARFLQDPVELRGSQTFGWYLQQKDLSPAIDRWVDRRREIIKRPFLATLERFVNPLKADIVIASAFHPPYGEKMRRIAEQAGFPGIIIVRNGMEGSCAFPLLRNAKLLCAARQPDGNYTYLETEFDARSELALDITTEEKWDRPSLEKNVEHIQSYRASGTSGYALMDHRVKATCRGLSQAIDWIRQQQDQKENQHAI